MICKCGLPMLESSCGFQTRTMDDKGNIIYEVCVHGIVVIDATYEEPRDEEIPFDGMGLA